MQESRHTGGFYRRFGPLIARSLLYDQGRLYNLLQQLEDHDNDPTTDTSGLTARQTRRVGESDVPDQFDLIMEEVKKELLPYCANSLSFVIVLGNKNEKGKDSGLRHILMITAPRLSGVFTSRPRYTTTAHRLSTGSRDPIQGRRE